MVTLLLFHNISPNSKAANQYTQYRLARVLEEKGVLHRIICLSAEGDMGSMSTRVVQINRKLGYRFCIYLLNGIHFLWKKFNGRFYKEVLFDYLCWKYISNNDVKLIYASKPLFIYCFKKARRNNIQILTRASVAHPLFNYYLIRNEEQRLGLRNSGSYSNNRRSARLLKSLHLSDQILANNLKGIPGFPVSTFAPCFSRHKLVQYKNMYIKPSTNANLEFRGKEAGITFIHVAHMSLIKGTHFLLEAWKNFQSEYKGPAKLVLLGRMDSNLTDLYPGSDLKSIANLEIAGFQKDPFSRYGYADAFISSSLSEAGPATIMEALCIGIPVVTSMNCGLSCLIKDNWNGFTYDFYDIEKLVEIFHWLVKNPDKIKDMKINAQETVRSYTNHAFEDEMWTIFKKYL